MRFSGNEAAVEKYRVTLTAQERADLEKLVNTGNGTAAKSTHARILLLADEGPAGPGWSDGRIVEALGTSKNTVCRVRERLVERGLEGALARKPADRVYARKLDGRAEAHLVALACSKPPDGRARWTLRLLAGRMVELDHVDTVSYETVREVLKKNEAKPWLKQMRCIPRKQSAEFVAAMEDVLGVYERPHDPARPLVCMDETNKQLITEVRDPLPMTPGEPARYDAEYARNGTANLFMASEPLAGWRHVEVTDTRKRIDFAAFVKDLVDNRYKDAVKVVLVMDNLNTHSTASLYEAFGPAEAKHIADKLEIHYTPKHGSWLNMAEIELSVPSRQCLDRRIGDKQTLATQVAAWAAARNADVSKIDWRFTTADARIKLKRLYPVHG